MEDSKTTFPFGGPSFRFRFLMARRFPFFFLMSTTVTRQPSYAPDVFSDQHASPPDTTHTTAWNSHPLLPLGATRNT